MSNFLLYVYGLRTTDYGALHVRGATKCQDLAVRRGLVAHSQMWQPGSLQACLFPRFHFPTELMRENLCVGGEPASHDSGLCQDVGDTEYNTPTLILSVWNPLF